MRGHLRNLRSVFLFLFSALPFLCLASAPAGADEVCLECHGARDLVTKRDGREVSLYVDGEAFSASIHGENGCTSCHADVDPDDLPHDQGLARVACGDCHGRHGVKMKDDLTSPTFSRNIPDLCGRCHREGQKAAVAYAGKQHEIVRNYTMSIHGKGLLQSGLMVTATCVDCHTAHRELPVSDAESTVNPEHIASTSAGSVTWMWRRPTLIRSTARCRSSGPPGPRSASTATGRTISSPPPTPHRR